MQEKKNGIGMKQRKWVTLESFDELLCTPPVASLLIPTATADTKANEPSECPPFALLHLLNLASSCSEPFGEVIPPPIKALHHCCPPHCLHR